MLNQSKYKQKKDQDFNQITNIVSDYFKAWKSYDCSTLRRIFDKNAKYIIRPRNRKLIGIEEICGYWRKNESLQRNLILNWSITEVKPLRISCDFTAQFYDNEEKQNQEIIGNIKYKICKNWKILFLSETYTKNIEE